LNLDGVLVEKRVLLVPELPEEVLERAADVAHGARLLDPLGELALRLLVVEVLLVLGVVVLAVLLN